MPYRGACASSTVHRANSCGSSQHVRQRWSTSHQFLQVIAARAPVVKFTAPACALFAARAPAVEYIALTPAGDRRTCSSSGVHCTWRPRRLPGAVRLLDGRKQLLVRVDLHVLARCSCCGALIVGGGPRAPLRQAAWRLFKS